MNNFQDSLEFEETLESKLSSLRNGGREENVFYFDNGNVIEIDEKGEKEVFA